MKIIKTYRNTIIIISNCIQDEAIFLWLFRFFGILNWRLNLNVTKNITKILFICKTPDIYNPFKNPTKLSSLKHILFTIYNTEDIKLHFIHNCFIRQLYKKISWQLAFVNNSNSVQGPFLFRNYVPLLHQYRVIYWPELEL